MKETEGGLRGNVLGPAQIAFFVVSAAGPLVAMAGGIPVSMALGNGPGTPALFAAASAILIAFAVGYTDMSRDIRNAGAFYAFAARGLNGVAAGASGILALFSYNALQIGLYGLFGVAASGLLGSLAGIDLPWWLFAALALALVAFLGYRQVDLSARILGVLVTLEYGIVLVLAAAIMAQGGAEGLSGRPFTLPTVLGGAPAIGLMFAFAAFVGFEATTIYSEEARDPRRTIPLATYLSVLLIGGFYTFCSWAVVMGVGVDRVWQLLSELGDPTKLLFVLSDRYVGAWLTLSMRVLFVTSTFASILAFHNAIARYVFAMGREGVLPLRLGAVHARYRSPHAGSLAQSTIALAALVLFGVAGADPIRTVFTVSSGVAILGIVVLMTVTAMAILAYLARTRPRALPLACTLLALIGLATVALLAVRHFSILAGTGGAMNLVLPATVLLSLALGATRALQLKRRDPERYARIGAGHSQTVSTSEPITKPDAAICSRVSGA